MAEEQLSLCTVEELARLAQSSTTPPDVLEKVFFAVIAKRNPEVEKVVWAALAGKGIEVLLGQIDAPVTLLAQVAFQCGNPYFAEGARRGRPGVCTEGIGDATTDWLERPGVACSPHLRECPHPEAERLLRDPNRLVRAAADFCLRGEEVRP